MGSIVVRSRDGHNIDINNEARSLTADTLSWPTRVGAMPSPWGSPVEAMTIADAYACIRVLADSAASLPLHVYRRTDDGRVPIQNRTAALLDNPAPAVTTASFIGQLVAHLNLWGNAYVGKYRDGSDQVHQLGLLAPDRMSVELIGGVPFFAYTKFNGDIEVLTTADVIHVKGLTLDGVMGVSPVQQCRTAIGLSRTMVDRADRFFANDARPGGALRFPERMDREKARDVVRVWSETHSGANANLPAVLTGGAEWVNIEMPADDAQFLEQRKLSATEVARIFRVPPHMIGAESGSTMTYANVEQESLDFVTHSLRPQLVAIEQALSADADLFNTTTYCQFSLDALLRADAKTRAQVYALALADGTCWMTRAEVRALEDLPPEPPTTQATTSTSVGGTA